MITRRLILAGGVAGLAALGLPRMRARAAPTQVVPAPLRDEQTPATERAVAVLAGGCFWGVQGVFQHVEGVTSAVSGYAGGEESTAHYQIVGTGATGHAEAVQVTFDPRRISYGGILQIFFSVAHDPTERDRQGPDEGPQYRSALFPVSDEQARIAAAYIAQLDQAKVFGGPIATVIEPGRSFYPAEAYHQDYLARHPSQPYIVINDLPKIAALKRLFPQRYRAEPVLVAAAGRSG